MPYQREKFSLWWIVLWTVLFFGGMILIFSFLLGNPFFSGKITGKYLFSGPEKSSIYLDGEFLAMHSSEGNIEIGKKEFCIEQYFFITRCFSEEIRSNAFKILEKLDISLFPVNIRTDTLTPKNKKVYFDPLLGGLFWIDFKKNIVWGIKKDDTSFFSQRLAPSLTEKNTLVEYSNDKKYFIITKKLKNPELNDTLDHNPQEKSEESSIDPIKVIFPENLIEFSRFSDIKDSLIQRKKEIHFLKSSVLIQKKGADKQLFASFSQPAQKIYEYQNNKIIEFPESIWIFTPENNQFKKLFSKQEKTRIFWHEKTASIFYIESDILKRVYLK